ncbi:MAG: hypothetical protein VX951_09395 [Planctomycetota bacterium]|nr:hypothetical protein [Planctomycetota bacterium]
MFPIRCLLLTSCLLLHACAEGKKDSDQTSASEVKISASHFMYGFGGDQLITDYPIPTSAVGTDGGFLTMTEIGEYTIKRTGSSPSSPVQYLLDADGLLKLVVPILGRAPTRYFGAYQQTGSGDLTQTFFFTDRYAPKDIAVVGFYWGTRSTTGHDMSKARGDWHMFSQHVLFSSSSSPNPHNIGRAFAGSLTIAAGTDTDDELSGSGFDSSSPNEITLKGTARALDTTGEIDFNLLYDADPRSIGASQAKDIILGADRDETDGETGLFALVRKFEFTDLDKAKAALAGRWHVGLQTIFVAPTVAGIDAANGTMTIDDKGGFKIEVIGSLGPGAGEETYRGSYEFVETATVGKWENLIELSVDGTNETWWAAVDSLYGSLVLLDLTVESRASGSPQLNMGLAVREVDDD